MATTYELVTEACNALRIPAPPSTTLSGEPLKIANYMARVYRDIQAKKDWWWLMISDLTQTLPKVTGTASVTQNSEVITLSTSPQRYGADADIGFNFFMVDGQVDDPGALYQLGSHGAGALATSILQASTGYNTFSPFFNGPAVYTGETNTAAAYTVWQPLIPLPQRADLSLSIAKLLTVQSYGAPYPLERVGWDDMLRLQRVRREGPPEAYTIQGFSASTTQRRFMWVYPFPDKAYRLQIYWKYSQDILASNPPADPFIPDEYSQVLLYGTLARAFPIVLNDIERGTFYQNLFNDMMNLMSAQQNEYASDKPTVDPSAFMYRRTTERSRLRGALTMGRYFDRLPYQF